MFCRLRFAMFCQFRKEFAHPWQQVLVAEFVCVPLDASAIFPTPVPFCGKVGFFHHHQLGIGSFVGFIICPLHTRNKPLYRRSSLAENSTYRSIRTSSAATQP